MSYRNSLAAALLLALAATPALADHASGVHWARSQNPFNVDLGDNLSASWDTYLAVASADWSLSSVLDTTVVDGGTRARQCRPTSGRVELCSFNYGGTGWIALTSLSVDGEHITDATVKLNDTYLGSPPYDALRQTILCSEIGQTLGLSDQDPSAVDTCMNLSGEHPNSHDYDQLESIYAHLDSGLAAAAAAPPPAMVQLELDGPGQWGRRLLRSADGRVELYLLDFGHGHKILTQVTWADRMDVEVEKGDPEQ